MTEDKNGAAPQDERCAAACNCTDCQCGDDCRCGTECDAA